jgi:hypothetical protein
MSAIPRFPITQGVDYTPNPLHRNWTSGKSQWTVQVAEEVAIFTNVHTSSWIEAGVGWGVYYNNGAIDYLGIAQDHITQVFLAKFVSDQNTWHGYPADHQRNRKDIPPPSITKRWLQNNILPRAKVRKILRGESCKL